MLFQNLIRDDFIFKILFELRVILFKLRIVNITEFEVVDIAEFFFFDLISIFVFYIGKLVQISSYIILFLHDFLVLNFNFIRSFSIELSLLDLFVVF